MRRKIKSENELVKIVQNLKKKGKKIVTYNGSFDILHIGHIKSFQEAKSLLDVLIILLNSDKSVKSYKGPLRPIIPEDERAETIAALAMVDYVTLFDDINPKRILARIKPHVHCNGSDWGRDCVERSIVEENGGRIHILRWKEGWSTTKLIQKILDVYQKPPVRAVFLDRDGTINLNKKGYTSKIEDFEFIPHALPALKKLSATDYKVIIITNQSGIGRGYYSQREFNILNEWMLSKLSEENVRIDKVYFCPHSPDDKCYCRKPNIGLVMQAVKDFGISLNDSWVIGDDERDVIAGREANVRTIKIGKKMPKELLLEPNYYVENLREAAEIILGKYGRK